MINIEEVIQKAKEDVKWYSNSNPEYYDGNDIQRLIDDIEDLLSVIQVYGDNVPKNGFTL